MTPDMKRLCQAAEAVEYSYQENLRPAEAEAVVRAVLMALKEPDEATEHAGWEPFSWGPGMANGDDPNPKAVLAAMIDAILAEPAKA